MVRTVAAAVLLVGLAGNMQAVPISTPDARAYETAHAQELSLQAESAARHAAALLAQTPNLQQTVLSYGVRRSPAHPGGNVVPVRQPILVHKNPSGLTLLSSFPVDIPSHVGIVLEPGSYHIPTPILTPPRNGWPTASVSPVVASVPDGGSTAMLLSAALSGVVLLRRKLAA